MPFDGSRTYSARTIQSITNAAGNPVQAHILRENVDLSVSGCGREELNAVASLTRCWYAVYTSPRHEKRVALHLESRAIDSFLPLYCSVRHWRNGCRVPVALPLFPNYLFVHIARSERVRVLQVPGVISLVGNGSEPTAMSDSEIEVLRKRIEHLPSVEPHPYLAVGDRVRITAGSLQGLEGIFVRKKNKVRLVITVEAIRKSFSIETDTDTVEAVQR